MMETKKPKSMTESELAKVGVVVVDLSAARLKCKKCGQVWSPMIQTGGRMPKNYWRCPNGCNS